jgi:hypothetical protein
VEGTEHHVVILHSREKLTDDGSRELAVGREEGDVETARLSESGAIHTTQATIRLVVNYADLRVRFREFVGDNSSSVSAAVVYHHNLGMNADSFDGPR